jgi:hypothetical protein
LGYDEMPALIREAGLPRQPLKVPFPPNCDIHGATSNDRFTSTPGDHRQDDVRLRLFNLEEPAMDEFKIRPVPRPWNKGKLVGQKTPLKLKEIWAIRVRLQVFRRTRELALFNLGIDSKLRARDLLNLKVRDISLGERIAARTIVVQQRLRDPCSSRSRSRRGAL